MADPVLQQSDATQDGAPIVPPPVGEQTTAQSQLPTLPGMVGGFDGRPLVVDGFYGPNPTLWSGGTFANPCNFPGWGTGYGGSYATYRFMLQCYKLRLARAAATSPVIASTWNYEAVPGLPPAALAMVQKCFDRLRPAFIAEAVRCVDYGWQPFEVVWDVQDGYWTIGRLKPLLVDLTTILTDRHGNVTGLRNRGTSGSTGGVPIVTGAAQPGEPLKPDDLLTAENKVLLITHDGEAGNPYGRSRLENVRQSAWPDWLSCNQQITALSAKLAGRQAYAIAATGGYDDPQHPGTFRTHMQDAADGLTGFAQGKCPVFPGVGLSSPDPKVQAKLSGELLIQFKTIDFGNESPAVASLLERTRHAENALTEGYLVPPRAISEGERTGGRSEAETHSDVATNVSQLLGNDIASDVQPLVDALLYLNLGLPPGSVKVRQSLLNDDSKATALQLAQSLGFSPEWQLAAELALDGDDLFKTMGMKLRKPMNDALDQVLTLKAQQQQAQAQANIAQAKRDAKGQPEPGQNGNGRMAAA